MTVTFLTNNQLFANSTRARAGDDPRYGLCRLLSSWSLRCDCSLTQCASHDSIGSVPLADSDWLVRVGLDNARISSRISASRSGGSGDRLINVIDAADLKLCLLLRSFLLRKVGIHIIREHQTIPRTRERALFSRSLVRCRALPTNGRIFAQPLNRRCTPALTLPKFRVTCAHVNKRKADRRSPNF